MEQNAPPPLVSGIPAGYEAVQEGLATILVPKGSAEPHSAERDATPDQTVFYNPIQQFNRDISVLVINEFAKEAVAAKTRDTAKRKAKARRADARKRRKLDGSGDATAAALPEKAAGSVEGRVKEEARGEEEEGGLSNDMPRQHTQQAAGVSGSAKPQNRERNTGGTSNDNTLAQHAPAPTLPPPRVPFTILDALAATGLRAIRYAKEIPLATAITANDLSPTATAAIRLNLQHNGLAASPASSSPSSSSSSSSSSAASTPVRVHTGNALALMYAAPYAQPPAPQRFDVIDLDPYGTAAPFFDAAVQALADGGLLCATCTDPGVFASAGFPEKAVALYGGVPVKGFYSHEAGLRLILHAIAASAARYGLAVEPLLALSVDYYARVFVRVRRSPATVKCLAGRTMLVYCCDQGCGAWATQPLLVNRAYHSRSGDTLFKHSLAQAPTATDRCEHCGSKTHVWPPYISSSPQPPLPPFLLPSLPPSRATQKMFLFFFQINNQKEFFSCK
jgi:tRNA (guanine26-N2/guanine27-N2)-dimethyltransferase